jgi:hypothetical protein
VKRRWRNKNKWGEKGYTETEEGEEGKYNEASFCHFGHENVTVNKELGSTWKNATMT